MTSNKLPHRPRTWIQKAVLLSVISYLGVILLLPLGAILSRVIGSGQPPVLTAMQDPTARYALGMSVILAIIAAVVGTLMGVSGAIVLVRHSFRGRRLFDALIDMPLAISPVMAGLAFLAIFGRNGWFEPVLNALNLKVTFAFPGMVIATLFVTFPFVLREVEYVLRELGTTEEEAAASLGASGWQTFWHVTLPNIRYGLGYGVILTTARALGEFGAVLVLGGAISGHTQTATTFIYAALDERQEAAAYGMAIILAIASVILLGILEWMKHRQESTLHSNSSEEDAPLTSTSTPEQNPPNVSLKHAQLAATTGNSITG
jgi:sulfate transport system permease protein